MKIVIAIVFSALMFACAGRTAAPAEVVETPTGHATYQLDTCARFDTAVAGQTLPCHYGDDAVGFQCDVADGLLVRGTNTCGVVPDSAERGAWLCMKVTCEVGR